MLKWSKFEKKFKRQRTANFCFCLPHCDWQSGAETKWSQKSFHIVSGIPYTMWGTNLNEDALWLSISCCDDQFLSICTSKVSPFCFTLKEPSQNRFMRTLIQNYFGLWGKIGCHFWFETPMGLQKMSPKVFMIYKIKRN